jgi:Tfp pilus assembly pilus retraction ATPase PilT
MQTGTQRGMQTLEQALADFVVRGLVSEEVALNRSSRPEQLAGLLKRGGGTQAPQGGLRVAAD